MSQLSLRRHLVTALVGLALAASLALAARQPAMTSAFAVSDRAEALSTQEPDERAQCSACRLPEETAEVPSPAFSSEWTKPEHRLALDAVEFRLQDQAGRVFDFSALAGKPLVLSFFYSRCENPNRCVRTMASAREIQGKLRESGMHKQVRIALMTYEPAFDTPQILRQFAADQGLESAEGLMLLRTDRSGLRRLSDLLKMPVNYNGEWVNTHGMVLYLVDRRMRLVRQYHSVLWNTEDVMTDLRRLIAEED